jgi:hypothetical protein
MGLNERCPHTLSQDASKCVARTARSKGHAHRDGARWINLRRRLQMVPKVAFHGDLLLMDEQKRAWKEIESARRQMRKELDLILTRLKESYVEIDLHETNATAWMAYINFKKDMTKPSKRLLSKPRSKRKSAKTGVMPHRWRDYVWSARSPSG